MSSNIWRLIGLCTILACGNPGVLGDGARTTVAQVPRYRSPFRYVIVYDINPPVAKGETPARTLVIFMDESSLTEKNLRYLFHLLDVRFPRPQEFEAIIQTNLQDIDTPEERDGPHVSESDVPEEHQHPYAYMKRTKKVSMFYTAFITQKGWENKTTVFSGSEK